MLFFMIDVVEELVDWFVDGVLVGFDYVYFVLGGFEVIEVVLKFVCQYFVEKGELQCCYFIVWCQSYYGNMFGVFVIGGNVW